MRAGDARPFYDFNPIAQGGVVKKANQFIAFNVSLNIQRMNTNPEHRHEYGNTRKTTSSAFYDDQCEDLLYSPQSGIDTPFQPNRRCEEIVAAMPNCPEIEYGGDRAFYIPILDIVAMPNRECFESPESFYSVLFHELIHSTGHKSRLDRIPITEPIAVDNRVLFAREELVAEMGSAFLCGYAGIENEVIDSAIEYLESHEPELDGDSRVIAYAIGAAERAAGYILGKT